jgi:hypothetical protein
MLGFLSAALAGATQATANTDKPTHQPAMSRFVFILFSLCSVFILFSFDVLRFDCSINMRTVIVQQAITV